MERGLLPSTPCATYSEKILESAGISVETVDLSEILGRVHRLQDSDGSVQEKLAAIQAYIPTQGIPKDALIKMAKLAAVTEHWMRETEVDVTAFQCWTAMEDFFGVVPCTVMSLMSERLMPSACEVDICGAVSMYALQLASELPSALMDWNNNYGDDPNKAVCFHCGNQPKCFFRDFHMDYQAIIAGTVGKERTFGTCVGRVSPGPVTFSRISTQDDRGTVAAYVGEGAFTDDPLQTFGGYAVVRIPGLQRLLRYICANGFEHHVATNQSSTASIVYEAAHRYLGWDIYWHRPEPGEEFAFEEPSAVEGVETCSAT